MYRFQTDRSSSRRRAFSVAAAALCLILLVLLSLVQVAHVHPTAADADHCQLCIALHAAAPAVLATALVILVQLGNAGPEYEASIVVRPWHVSLFTRPPPAAH